MMNLKDKYLYHQIHPLKLLTDICSGFVSLYPLWQHELAIALAVMLVPPPIASALVMRFANLEPYRQSAFGRYIAVHMTHAMEAVRLAGMIAMAVGAWLHIIWLIPAGVVVVLFGWLRGVLIPWKSTS